MNNNILFCILASLMFAFSSCSKQDTLKEMEHIKAIGDENPQEALVMLDSLVIDVRDESEYVRAKYDLLAIRLNDKADNIPSSDIVIRKLVEYFEEKGSTAEKQEVNYYAGSVYRDLHDTPRALEYFFKSLDHANEGTDCDSIMLRNTYSNLNDLHYGVQNYKEAARMAEQELRICKLLKKDCVLSFMHMGAAYHALKEKQQAKDAFDSAYKLIKNSKDFSKYQSDLEYLIYDFSELGEIQKAKECMTLIENNPLTHFSAFLCIAFAYYYEDSGNMDSAAIYCKRILDDGTDVNNMYDAAKMLFRIYNGKGDDENASRYGKTYMELSDSLDFGTRQELAATVNNEYKYHLDQKKEKALRDEKERYRSSLVIVSLAAVLLASIGYILYVRRKNMHLRKIVALSSELKRLSDSEKQLIEEIEEKKQQLEEKKDQHKAFIQLLHQSELEGKSEEVINAIKQTAMGKKNMSSAEWKQLYHAVDDLYPSFKDRFIKELGTFTEQQMQVCYLMRAGLSNIQIQNITNLSRVTVWRWVKKFDWVLIPDDSSASY